MGDKDVWHPRKTVQEAHAILQPQEVRELLDQLCIRLGYCLKADARNLLIASPPTNAVAFTRAVLAAEGLDPDLARRPAYREVSEFVHAAFLRHSEQE